MVQCSDLQASSLCVSKNRIHEVHYITVRVADYEPKSVHNIDFILNELD